MSYSFIDLISGNECIGDSREKINDNFLNLETSVYLLSTDLGVVKIDLNVAKNDITTTTTKVNNLSGQFLTIQTSFNANNVDSLATLGTLVSSLSVYNASGNYLGYLPLYR